MIGITSFGAYVPYWRLNKNAIGAGSHGEKAICNFDEDCITMAVTSSIDCMKGMDRSGVDGLFLASTTLPYSEKSSASTIAIATDLRRDVRTVDFSHSLRAGTGALLSALDAVKAKSAEKVIVTGSDCRIGTPSSAFERNFGDGAGSLMVGDKEIIATFEASHSVSDEILDSWRSEGDRFVRSWEERFSTSQGYLPVVIEAVSGLFKKCSLTAEDFTTAIFYSPDGRRHADVAAKLGFDLKTQVQDPLIKDMGNTGAAASLMLLIASLEKAKSGDRILLVSYGDGCDALSFRVTDSINKMANRLGMKGHLESKKLTDDYRKYLFWRGLLPSEKRVETVSFISVPAIHRERNTNLRLLGCKCLSCGTIQFPPQRVCTKCHTKDQFEPYRFSDKKARVFTFTADHLSNPASESPTVTSTIDFEAGGRLQCYMTDFEVEAVEPGLLVEMTFRRMFHRDGIYNYAWKSMPLRQ